MNPVEERPVLSLSEDLADFRMGLIGSLGRISTRTNLQVPNDGSELTDQLSYLEISNATVTSHRHDFDLDPTVAFHYIVSNADYNITGIANGAANDPGTGRVMHLINSNVFNNFDFLLMHENVNSLPENRFINPGGASIGLVPHGGHTLYYDGSVSRWRLRL